MEGWIKLHRKIQDNWIFSDAERLRAWIIMLLEVNIKDNEELLSGEIVECKRGQSIYSLSTWARKFGKNWSIQKVRTFFKLLKKDNMIEIEGLRKTTRITICNYESYQDRQQGDNKEITRRKHSDNKEITTKEEWKEGKEGKEEKEKKNFDLSFVKFDYKKMIDDFIDHRIKIDKPFKNVYEVKNAYNELMRLSKMNKAEAQKIVEQSILKNWASFFPIKNSDQGKEETPMKDKNGNMRSPEQMKQEPKVFRFDD